LRLWLMLWKVSRVSMKKALKTQRDLAIVPGGVEEVTLCSHKAERSYILNRKGE
jgi:hypothetical protein